MFLLKNKNSFHNVSCQYSDFILESILGSKYICFINDELLRIYQIILFIDSWYVIFEFLKVDRIFFDKIKIDLTDIRRIGRCYLYLQNLWIFFTIWFEIKLGPLIISTRFL